MYKKLSDEQLTVLGRGVCCLSSDQLPVLTRLAADTVHKLQSGMLVCHICIGVNAAGITGVATPQYLTCTGRPVLTTHNILASVLFFSLQRNFKIPQVWSIITDLFTDFSQLVMRFTPAHVSNDLIITRNWVIY